MNNSLSENITIRTSTGGTDSYLGKTGGTNVDVQVFANIEQMSMSSVLRYGLDVEYTHYMIEMSYLDVSKAAKIIHDGLEMTIKSVLNDTKKFKTKIIAVYAK